MNKLATAATAAILLLSVPAWPTGSGKRLLKTFSIEIANGPGFSVNSASYELPSTARNLKCPAKVKRCMIEIEMTVSWVVADPTTTILSFMSINGAASTTGGSVSGPLNHHVLSHWKFTRNVGVGTHNVKFFGSNSAAQFLSGYSVTASIYAR